MDAQAQCTVYFELCLLEFQKLKGFNPENSVRSTSRMNNFQWSPLHFIITATVIINKVILCTRFNCSVFVSKMKKILRQPYLSFHPLELKTWFTYIGMAQQCWSCGQMKSAWPVMVTVDFFRFGVEIEMNAFAFGWVSVFNSSESNISQSQPNWIFSSLSSSSISKRPR